MADGRPTPRSSALESLRLGDGGPLPEGRWTRATRAGLLLATSLGVQATFWAMIVLGPLAPQLDPATLTRMGRQSLRPEYEMPIFYAGCVGTVLLAGLVLRGLEARIRGRTGAALEQATRRAEGGYAWLGVGSLALFLALVCTIGGSAGADGRISALRSALLALPPLAAAVAAVVDHALARRLP